MPKKAVQQGRKRVGTIDAGESLYSTTRADPTHVARKFDAYGIQATILDDLLQHDVATIRLDVERADGAELTYLVPTSVWATYGTRAILRTQDGPQVFLPRRYLGRPVRYLAPSCGRPWPHACAAGRGRCILGSGHSYRLGTDHKCTCGETLPYDHVGEVA